MNHFDNSRDFALACDADDPLRSMRDEFHIPLAAEGTPKVYLVGNSLGLQPRRTGAYLQAELDKWRLLAVEAHFAGDRPWMPYHEFLAAPMARIVGALPDEVVIMNSLTVNLHLMMATFYRPHGQRTKVLLEKGAFPSDHFAIESHLAHRGVDPAEAMLLVGETEGELLQTEAICSTIDRYANELALVLLPGVQYYTGQFLDLPQITSAAHRHEIPVGFDLAHAAGNVPLSLHDWNVDFAVWCTYKYLNSGPGSLGGCYIHQRHAADPLAPRLAGWWGQDKATRFEMKNEFHAIPTAEGWQLSNPAILSMAAVRASLDVFKQAGGMQPLREKSEKLTGYLDWLLRQELGRRVSIATPNQVERRGCQLSLQLTGQVDGKRISGELADHGCLTDWRQPHTIRVAPVPLYNSYEDVFRFVNILKNCVA
jgi:kynureninase